MAHNGRDDNRDNPNDNTFRGLMRGLRDFVTQIADPTAPPRPQPISGPGRRPPRQAARAVANDAGVREPIVDIFDEGAFIRVVADMPGADPATLKVRGADNRLAIVASGPARRYERVVTLPAPVDPERAAPPTMINGIMEVLLPAIRQRPDAPDTKPAVSTPATNGVHPVEEATQP